MRCFTNSAKPWAKTAVEPRIRAWVRRLSRIRITTASTTKLSALKVGETVTPEEAVALARTCALNALAAAAAAAGGLSAITRIIKVTGFVASAPGFTGQPQVVNGASDLLTEVFGEAGRHARSAVGVAVLPMDAPVEVELIAEVGGSGTGGGNTA